MSLRERIEAELDRLQRAAETASVGGKWLAIQDHAESHAWNVQAVTPGNPSVYIAGGLGGGLTRAVAEHIAAWGPATALRLIAHYREITDEHAPGPDHLHGPGYAGMSLCPDLLDLADVLGVPTEEPKP